MKRLLVLTLLAASMAAHADDKPCEEWCTPFFKALPTEEYVYDSMTILDMAETMDIKHHPNLQEMNPFLGPHPSDGKVVGMIFLGDALHAMVTYELVDGGAPKGLIKAWEYISIGSDAYFVVHNYSLGLRFRF